ncbi:spsA [Marinibacterium profundimaris]|uniref:SpsA n=1 Tax=Marinibacterium profundimaris TaxID=1679460 RepID=A0A225NT52_9RHOB|nr:spsA [Marinibacterium profundimaris]
MILTRDEARHIGRALASVSRIARRIVVVDSGSTDDTIRIARAAGARVLRHPWTNYATQLNWALDQLPPETGWVLRLDADEIVTPPLAHEIARQLPLQSPDTDGIYVSRRMTFMGRPIRWGGVFPVRVLRLFRHGRGRCEARWMDEHVLVSGPTGDFGGEILDDNRNTLGWWTDKHNAYAAREVVDLLNLEHRFLAHETIAGLQRGRPSGVKRWIKEHLYARLPGGWRAGAYFLYRYVVRLGFLDGREGAAFHVLQGFWYRYLVDAKLYQVRRHMRETGADAPTAIAEVLGIRVLD